MYNMTLYQWQEWIRRLHNIEGKGFYLQKATIEFLKNNQEFENLFMVNGNLDQQIMLTDDQVGKLTLHREEIIDRAKQIEEIEQNEKERGIKKPINEDKIKAIEYDMKRLGIKWK